MTEIRNCERCHGLGTTFSKGFTSLEGTVYPDRTQVCSGCNGSKTYTAPDVDAIVAAVVSSKGRTKGQVKASWNVKKGPDNRWTNISEARSYYCWRMIRFHSGADCTMPMTAQLVLRSDPFRKELDIIADQLALKLCGDNMGAARRWHRAFYGT